MDENMRTMLTENVQKKEKLLWLGHAAITPCIKANAGRQHCCQPNKLKRPCSNNKMSYSASLNNTYYRYYFMETISKRNKWIPFNGSIIGLFKKFIIFQSLLTYKQIYSPWEQKYNYGQIYLYECYVHGSSIWVR